jgi:hypothetical protein
MYKSVITMFQLEPSPLCIKVNYILFGPADLWVPGIEGNLGFLLVLKSQFAIMFLEDKKKPHNPVPAYSWILQLIQK